MNANLSSIETLNVLVVDDHPVNLMFIKKLLQKMGIKRIDSAEDGLQALDKIAANAYDLVFMDCQMPEMDGYTATRTLRDRELGTGKRTTIIAMTANAMVGDREKCLNAGMDDYISKPIALDKLVNVMTHWLPENNVSASSAGAPVEEKTVCAIDIPVDMEHLELFTDGNRDEEKAICDIFFQQADKNLVQLHRCIETGAQEEWKSAAHKFKGAAANLGARKLAAYCERAENTSDLPEDAKRAMLAQIAEELSQIRTFFAGRT